MTIIATTTVRDGIVMGSESREIRASAEWLKESYEHKNNSDFTVANESSPKTFILAGRYGLNYSGPADYLNNWCWAIELLEMQRLAEEGTHTLHALAAHLATRLTNALKDYKFSFHLGGYQNGHPVMISCSDGALDYRWGFHLQNGRFQAGMDLSAGEVRFFEKLLANEAIHFDRMSLPDAIEFTELIVTAGSKFPKFFEAYADVSGGPVNLLVITPDRCEFLKHCVLGTSPLMEPQSKEIQGGASSL